MEYEFLRSQLSQASLEKYSQLLSSVFVKSKKSPKQYYEYLKWQYLENPLGTAIGYDAFYNNELVAHYANIPSQFYLNGKITKCLIAVNLAVYPEHRGKGLFIQLANKSYDDARSQGYEFVLAAANQNSSHGFLKRLGFYLIAPLEVKVGIGKIDFDPSIDYKLKALWSNASLKWRLSNPYAKYFKSGSTIVADTNLNGFYAQFYNIINSSLNVDFLKVKNPLLKVWIGLALNKSQKGIFINLPHKLKPAPLNLSFKDLTGKSPILKKEDVFYELIDFDAF